MAIAFILIFLTAITADEKPLLTPYQLTIPKGFPQPKIPENNLLTQERVDLGRMLFYDPVLSVDSTVSCASCHHQALAFADNQPISPGVAGRLAMRNAPTLSNVVYNPTLLFDGYLPTLEMQVLVPIQEHAEMAYNIVLAGNRLKENADYVKRSYEAYGRKPDPFVITRALSAFERTMISGNSKFDQQVYQNKKVMTKSELRGMDLFQNQLHCTNCHSGFNFTNYTTVNNGLYEVYQDSGRARATHLPEDRAVFKVPTLRNIALTAPYMHDGSMATLEEVILHYESGGEGHVNKSEFIQPFRLSKRERKDLIRFLECLTDETFINNPDFSNPFEN
jgi:cytochrome c peroxidase